jgi:hypothetical protein
MWLDIMVPIALVYGCVVTLVFVFQSHLVYYPQIGREVVSTPRAFGLAHEALEIATDDGEKLAAWWVPAEDARGTVLLFHGNAGNISHRLDYLRMFNRLRYSTLIIDYRGYGTSTGSPSEEGTCRGLALPHRSPRRSRYRYRAFRRITGCGSSVMAGGTTCTESARSGIGLYLGHRAGSRGVLVSAGTLDQPLSL